MGGISNLTWHVRSYSVYIHDPTLKMMFGAKTIGQFYGWTGPPNCSRIPPLSILYPPERSSPINFQSHFIFSTLIMVQPFSQVPKEEETCAPLLSSSNVLMNIVSHNWLNCCLPSQPLQFFLCLILSWCSQYAAMSTSSLLCITLSLSTFSFPLNRLQNPLTLL